MTRWVALGVLCLAFGCGSDDAGESVNIVITDASDALTDEPGDELFVLTLDSESAAIDTVGLDVVVTPPGETAIAGRYVHQDDNDDQVLDVGESLVVSEFSSTDVFNPSHAGQRIRVEVTEAIGPGRVLLVFTGEWLAD